MLKKTLLGLSALGIVSFGTVNAAELVCVNGDALMQKATYAQELRKQIEEKVKEIQKNFEEKIGEIQKKLQQLQKELQSGLLSDEAKKQKEQEFLKLQQELRKYQLQYQQEVRKYFQEEFMKLDKLVKAAIKALAQTEGFKAVANCNDLLYYDPVIDITDEVAKAVDRLAKSTVRTEEAVEGKTKESMNHLK